LWYIQDDENKNSGKHGQENIDAYKEYVEKKNVPV